MTEPEAGTELVTLWVVYDHPGDHPDDYVARQFHVHGDGSVALSEVSPFIAPDLEVVRRFIRAVAPGAVSFDRAPDDAPVILESWI